MTTQPTAADVMARLAEEQTRLRTRLAEKTERLQRIAFAAETGDRGAVRERTALLADQAATKHRLEDIATAIGSAEILAREDEERAATALREVAMRDAQEVQEQRLGIAARLDEALRAANEAWTEFVATNARLAPLTARAGLQPFVGRHDAGWLMRAFWHLAPDVARLVRLAPQLRTFGQPLAVSLATRWPNAATAPTHEPAEQEIPQ